MNLEVVVEFLSEFNIVEGILLELGFMNYSREGVETDKGFSLVFSH